MAKSLFEDELIVGMENQLRKQANGEKPGVAKAADCLHAALEIFEEQGMAVRADQVLQLLQKLAQSNEARDVMHMPSPKAVMEAGMSQKWIERFKAGDLRAVARFNQVLRGMGLSDHQIGNYIGKNKVMSEDTAKALLDQNSSLGEMQDWMRDPTKPIDPNNPQPGETISFRSAPLTGPGDTLSFESLRDKPKPTPSGEALEFKSMAQKRAARPDLIHDTHIKGLTSDKEVENLKHHGTMFNMADDGGIDPEFAELLGSPSFDVDASDDELMGMEIGEDTLEVFDNDSAIEDFEDERD